MKEITKRSVLLECLEHERELWKLCSRKYNRLEPMKGMEERFEEQAEKCRILQEMIQAMESEPVRRAIAAWQEKIMVEPDAIQIAMKELEPAEGAKHE